MTKKKDPSQGQNEPLREGLQRFKLAGQGEVAVLPVNDGLSGGHVKGWLLGFGVKASVHKEVPISPPRRNRDRQSGK